MTVGRSTSLTHQIGSAAEDKARDHLMSHGLQVIAQNWHVAQVGELDLIMLDKTQQSETMVFVEVRKRHSAAYGHAVESITAAKRRKIIQTAQYFLAEHAEYASFDCRFDVVAIQGSQLVWHSSAFMVEE